MRNRQEPDIRAPLLLVQLRCDLHLGLWIEVGQDSHVANQRNLRIIGTDELPAGDIHELIDERETIVAGHHLFIENKSIIVSVTNG